MNPGPRPAPHATLQARARTHEGGDLLHEPLDARLGPGLEQRCDGERGDGSVGVVDETLHVHVARCHRERVYHRDLVEGAHGGEAEAWLGRAEEELQHRHRRCQLALGHARERADGRGSLVYDHVALVSQRRLEVVEERPITRLGIGLVLHDPLGVPDEQALGHRALERRPGQRGHHLGHSQPILPLDLVQQRQRVVLHRLRV